MTRLTSLTPWLAAFALVLCAQGAAQAEERFTLNIPGVSMTVFSPLRLPVTPTIAGARTFPLP